MSPVTWDYPILGNFPKISQLLTTKKHFYVNISLILDATLEATTACPLLS